MSQLRCYKAVRPNGTDFYSGTIDYAAALATGEPIQHPNPSPGARHAAYYFSVATTPTDCTGVGWPCRLFVVEPVGETWAPSPSLPCKVACTSLRVVEEVSATLTLGPQADEIVALIERCTQITWDDARKLAAETAAEDTDEDADEDAARTAAWDTAWVAARDATWSAARTAAWVAAKNAARSAAWVAAKNAARAAAARDATWDAAAGLVVRDLIGEHGFTQERYDLLTRAWRSAIGPIHPDDAPIVSEVKP
jgi:hypothetical protein